MSTPSPTDPPHVVFLCKSNRGKSRLAGAIAVDLDADRWVVSTAGTHPAPPDAAPNAEVAASLAERDIAFPDQAPRGLDPAELAAAARVVLIGSPTDEQWTALDEAGVERSDVTVWETVEPSQDGIEGAERMRLIRDDIADRVAGLHTELIED